MWQQRSKKARVGGFRPRSNYIPPPTAEAAQGDMALGQDNHRL